MALWDGEVRCLYSEYEQRTEDMALTERQRKFVAGEKARYRAEVTARHAKEAQTLASEVGDLKTAVLTGLQEVANGYQQVEADFELGDIDRNEARGRIQRLQAEERRLQERQNALQSVLDRAEKHSAMDPVDYEERMLRAYRSVERPVFHLPV